MYDHMIIYAYPHNFKYYNTMVVTTSFLLLKSKQKRRIFVICHVYHGGCRMGPWDDLACWTIPMYLKFHICFGTANNKATIWGWFLELHKNGDLGLVVYDVKMALALPHRKTHDFTNFYHELLGQRCMSASQSFQQNSLWCFPTKLIALYSFHDHFFWNLWLVLICVQVHMSIIIYN